MSFLDRNRTRVSKHNRWTKEGTLTHTTKASRDYWEEKKRKKIQKRSRKENRGNC